MATNANRGFVALFKRGWHEIPEIVGSGVLAICGLGILGFALHTYYSRDGDNRPYRKAYVVYRHDDPRVPTLKTHCDVTCKP